MSVIKENDPICRFWATEISPRGNSHRCHAEGKGLRGGYHARSRIKDVLQEALTQGGFSEAGTWQKGTWRLIACEPNHDGKACGSCEHSIYESKKELYGEV